MWSPPAWSGGAPLDLTQARVALQINSDFLSIVKMFTAFAIFGVSGKTIRYLLFQTKTVCFWVFRIHGCSRKLLAMRNAFCFYNTFWTGFVFLLLRRLLVRKVACEDNSRCLAASRWHRAASFSGTLTLILHKSFERLVSRCHSPPGDSIVHHSFPRAVSNTAFLQGSMVHHIPPGQHRTPKSPLGQYRTPHSSRAVSYSTLILFLVV